MTKHSISKIKVKLQFISSGMQCVKVINSLQKVCENIVSRAN